MTSGNEGGHPFGKLMRDKYFGFDPSFLPLNHGSYGMIPTSVRDHQRHLHDSIDARPDPFIRFEVPKLLLESRTTAADYLGSPPENVVLVPNATIAINVVLRNLAFQEGDVIMYFSFAYGACVKTIQHICESTPARQRCIDMTFPVEDDEIVDACVQAFHDVRGHGQIPKLLLFETVVTCPGLCLPWERLIKCCRQAGVLSLVDGAHGIGHIDLKELHQIGPDFFTSNCHKWLYTPRSCAVLYVPRHNHHLIRSSIPTSHGFQPLSYANGVPVNPLTLDQHTTYFAELFNWVGTMDQTPYLCVSAAAAFRTKICGGEDRIREYCFTLAQQGGDLVASRLNTQVLRNSTFSSNQCCFTNVRLPLSFAANQELNSTCRTGELKLGDAVLVAKWIMERCMVDYNTWIPVNIYNGAAWVRLSAQIYLGLDDFGKIAEILSILCLKVERGQWSTYREYVK